jgi:hypothetical protein
MVISRTGGAYAISDPSVHLLMRHQIVPIAAALDQLYRAVTVVVKRVRHLHQHPWLPLNHANQPIPFNRPRRVALTFHPASSATVVAPVASTPEEVLTSKHIPHSFARPLRLQRSRSLDLLEGALRRSSEDLLTPRPALDFEGGLRERNRFYHKIRNLL